MPLRQQLSNSNFYLATYFRHIKKIACVDDMLLVLYKYNGLIISLAISIQGFLGALIWRSDSVSVFQAKPFTTCDKWRMFLTNAAF